MDEKERLKRHRCKVFFRVINEETQEVIGHLVDLTVQGLRLISEKPVNPDAIFLLRLVLPVEIDGTMEFSLPAISRWCTKDNISGFYNAGFEFRKVPLKTVRLIEKVIGEFCIEE